MKLEIFADIPQRSPEWYALRCGILTASNFNALLAGGERRMRDTLIRRCAAEIVTGEPAENYDNAYMQRGRDQEAAARAKYALVYDCDPQPIGFARRGRVGCSPDSLIGANKVLEIKTEKAEILVDTLRRDEFPLKHVPQTQGQLWVMKRELVDLAIYAPKMPLFKKTAKRDERYIKNLAAEVDRAYVEIDNLVRRIKGYGIV